MARRRWGDRSWWISVIVFAALGLGLLAVITFLASQSMDIDQVAVESEPVISGVILPGTLYDPLLQLPDDPRFGSRDAFRAEIERLGLTRHGIVNQENMDLDELAADGVYVFTYVYSPVPIAGATGSAGSPIAID